MYLRQFTCDLVRTGGLERPQVQLFEQTQPHAGHARILVGPPTLPSPDQPTPTPVIESQCVTSSMGEEPGGTALAGQVGRWIGFMGKLLQVGYRLRRRRPVRGERGLRVLGDRLQVIAQPGVRTSGFGDAPIAIPRQQFRQPGLIAGTSLRQPTSQPEDLVARSHRRRRISIFHRLPFRLPHSRCPLRHGREVAIPRSTVVEPGVGRARRRQDGDVAGAQQFSSVVRQLGHVWRSAGEPDLLTSAAHASRTSRQRLVVEPVR